MDKYLAIVQSTLDIYQNVSPNMDLRTIEELALLTGKSRKTIDRRLSKFAAESPEKFKSLITRTGQGGRMLYSLDIIPIIGELKEEILQAIENTHVPEIKQPKQKKVKAEKAQIINIDEHTPERNEQFALFQVIMEQYKTGEHSLAESITLNNIEVKTFWKWVNTDPEMNGIYRETAALHKQNSFDAIRDIALRQLKKSIQGYDIDLESTSYIQRIGPDGQVIRIPQEHRIQKKHVLPRSDLIMFALTNRDPEFWKRMWNSKAAEGVANSDPLEALTDGELLTYLETARKQGLLIEAGDQQNTI